MLPSGARVRGRKLDEISNEHADFLLALAEQNGCLDHLTRCWQAANMQLAKVE